MSRLHDGAREGEEAWGREALRDALGASEDELTAASLDFARACLDTTPARRFGGEFAAGRSGAAERLGPALLDGLALFRSDMQRFQLHPATPQQLFERLVLAPSLLAVWFYRVSHQLFLRRIERVPDVLAAVGRQLSGVEIYYSARIGPGLKVIHGLGTVIGAQCDIGSDFTIYQNATIGDKLGRETGPRPVLGDQVIVSAGAQVLGPVEIGSKTVIGANAVVLRSLPARCVAVGVPAEVRVENLSDAAFGAFWEAIKR